MFKTKIMIATASGTGNRFPDKLYAMLEWAEESSSSSTVAWSPSGSSFVVRNADRFMRDVVPRYFKQTKMRSFTRQLNIWGFRSVAQDEWTHEHFIRGKQESLHLIRRVNVVDKPAVRKVAKLTDYPKIASPTLSLSPIIGGSIMEGHGHKNWKANGDSMVLVTTQSWESGSNRLGGVAILPPLPLTVCSQEDYARLLSNILEMENTLCDKKIEDETLPGMHVPMKKEINETLSPLPLDFRGHDDDDFFNKICEMEDTSCDGGCYCKDFTKASTNQG